MFINLTGTEALVQRRYKCLLLSMKDYRVTSWEFAFRISHRYGRVIPVGVVVKKNVKDI